jgi:hypothetical protein
MVQFQTMSEERQNRDSYQTAKAIPDGMEGERLVAVEPEDEFVHEVLQAGGGRRHVLAHVHLK